MSNGKVKWFDSKKGFGFITRDADGADVFVHHTDILGHGYRALNTGDQVELDVTQGERGLKAVNVRLVRAAPCPIRPTSNLKPQTPNR